MYRRTDTQYSEEKAYWITKKELVYFKSIVEQQVMLAHQVVQWWLISM